MRAERNNPRQRYIDFWDWLRTDWHPAWILTIFVGYLYYLTTTEEV
jgi:hypothetical protein